MCVRVCMNDAYAHGHLYEMMLDVCMRVHK